jgi:hypothetical protein
VWSAFFLFSVLAQHKLWILKPLIILQYLQQSKFLKFETALTTLNTATSYVSQEILDKFRPKFFQFDLYTGHKTSPSKPHFIDFMSISDQCKFGLASKIICNFGQFFAWKSCIRLIRGSTYSRVYTVVQKNLIRVVS